jgi:hypothetical protein
LGIHSVFPQGSAKLLQGQPAKKKNKKICLTQLFYPHPRRGTPPPLTASRKTLNLLINLIQTCAEKIPLKTGLKDVAKTMLALTKNRYESRRNNKKPGSMAGL